MNIQQTIDFLENLKNISEKKSEINLYKLFSELLRSLENLQLSDEKIERISQKLEELHIDSPQENQYRYIKKQYIAFTQYLETQHKLIEKGRYLGLGMTFGMIFGLVITTATGFEFGMGSETTGGLIGGMLLGMIIGGVMDKKAKNENRVLKIKK